jgi:hypothetical protein
VPKGGFAGRGSASPFCFQRFRLSDAALPDSDE